MVPVLLIVFNRPDKVSKMLGQLRKVKPKKLFVFADGARTSNEKDSQLCNEVRTLIKVGIDWDCNLQLNFSNTNLGCGLGPVTAIDWFFSKVESGIILEDDCFPDESFFPFCEELLEKYQHNDDIMEIRSSFYMGIKPRENTSYSFSRISGTWGWATWKRAWLKFDYDMKSFPKFKEQNGLLKIFNDKYVAGLLMKKYESGYLKLIDGVWDCQWQFTLMNNEGISIMPHQSLVKNIGFGEDSTHCFTEHDEYKKVKLGQMKFPLVHPLKIEVNTNVDVEFYHYWRGVNKESLLNRFRKLIPDSLRVKFRYIKGAVIQLFN